jgi:ABC-type nitrate/sulfonate/bicarbonate transport system substrate-binding protein
MSDHHHLHEALGRAGGTASQRTVVLPFDAAAYLVSGLVDAWREDLAAELKVVGGELSQYVSASRQ